MDIGFHRGRIGAQLASLSRTLLACQSQDAMVNLLGRGRAEQGEGAAEGAEIGCDFGIKAGEAAIDQIAA